MRLRLGGTLETGRSLAPVQFYLDPDQRFRSNSSYRRNKLARTVPHQTELKHW